ncbi:MAG TPA: hypothetical protein VF157_14570, partial [Chloroflexota bacterium]
SATELRQNIYQLLDRILETGEPLEVVRRGRRLRIAPEQTGSKLDRLVPHPGFMLGDPEDYVHMDWSSYWDPDRALEP